MSSNPETIPIRTAPTCPKGVPNDVRIEFERFAAMLGDRAEPVDATALHMLAQNLAVWRRATTEVNRLGLLVSSDGVTIQNPSIAIAAKAEAQATKLLRELCLTPATRAKRRRGWDEPPLPPLDEDE